LLFIETAGQSSPQGSSAARLIGIVDAKKYRDQVLQQRDLLVEENTVNAPDVRERTSARNDTNVLEDIRDTLNRIEKHLTGKTLTGF